jgi:hypothetical protein
MAKKKSSKPISKKPQAPAKKKAAKSKPVAQPSNGRPRASWLDAESHQPVIERYARRLGPFVEAMADGKIDDGEVRAQEKRLVKLMKEVEPTLSPALHEKVTQLLYELTAYNLMHILHSMEQARPKTTFQG